MVIERTVEVFGDSHTLDPQLIVVEIAVGIGERGVAAPDGFYFGTVELDSGDETLANLVIESSPFILYEYFFFSHLD